MIPGIRMEPEPAQRELFSDDSLIRERLDGIDIDTITPLEALRILSDLKGIIKRKT